MLSTPWEQRKTAYDIVVVGSGYGGAITAARLAAADLHPKPSVCILERGKEWQPGEFPDSVMGLMRASKTGLNPLGVFELLHYPDVSVLQGSGLGGTSLINANVALEPDREIFEESNWPAGITYEALRPFFDRARQTLAAGPHPRGRDLAKVRALERRATELGTSVQFVDIAVNFTINGNNEHGVRQVPCDGCGNCTTGCNSGAKNTLCMNYLPMARNAGAEILSQSKAEWIEKRASGGWRIHGTHVNSVFSSSPFTIDAGEVVLAAGALHSTEILLRSQMHGLSVAPALGTRFSANGDFFGLAYNCDVPIEMLGYSAEQRRRAGNRALPGPSIVGLVRHNDGAPCSQRIAVEDFGMSSAYVLGAKMAFAALRGKDTGAGNERAQRARLWRDLNPFNPAHEPGAMEHSILYLAMVRDSARGRIVLDTSASHPEGRARVCWDGAGHEEAFYRVSEELGRHARSIGGNYIPNPSWSAFRLGHLFTGHPIGGCPMGDDCEQGAVDSLGRVFAGDGSLHRGLYVSDGSVIPGSLGANPLLTISAITERFVEHRIIELQSGVPEPPPRPARLAQSA